MEVKDVTEDVVQVFTRELQYDNIIGRDALIAIITYFSKLNKTDIYVRKCGSSSWHACCMAYLRSLRPPTKDEAHALETLTRDADKILFDGRHKRLYNIPWKIVFFHPDVEGGFPHTHVDVIMLPFYMIANRDSKDVVKTLIHEKIHIYQRFYPIPTHNLLCDVWSLRVESLRDHPKTNDRRNPDASDIVYKVGREDSIRPTYKNNATHLSHIHDRRDHPYEIMAYILTDMLVGGSIHSDPIYAPFISEKTTQARVRAWMQWQL
jgi:hypothetical protein